MSRKEKRKAPCHPAGTMYGKRHASTSGRCHWFLGIVEYIEVDGWIGKAIISYTGDAPHATDHFVI